MTPVPLKPPFRAALALAFSIPLLAGCAAPRPVVVEADAAEALRLAQEARLAHETQSSRLQELEGQVRDLAHMLSWTGERIQQQERALDSLRKDAGLSPRPTPAPAPQGARRVTPDEAAEYRKALDRYFARDYAGAVRAFEALLRDHPRGAYAGNAQYWIGESHYGMGDYAAALAAFHKVFDMPGNNKHDDAQLKIGYCHLRLGNRELAREAFRKLVSSYPDSEYVERARSELENLSNR